MKKNKKRVLLLIVGTILLSSLIVKTALATEKSSFLNSIFSRSLNGWHKEDNVWYFYNNNEKSTGWVKNKGQWYYLDKETAVMQTGWIEDSGKNIILILVELWKQDG